MYLKSAYPTACFLLLAKYNGEKGSIMERFPTPTPIPSAIKLPSLARSPPFLELP